MVTAGDFKNGLTIEYDGNICQIIEFQHVKQERVLLSLELSLRISSVEVLLRHLSDQLRNSHRLVSTVRICSIFTQMMISTPSWM